MKNNVMLKVILPVFIWFLTVPAFSKIVLPEIFSDRMVLQQQTEAPIWGKSTPNKNVRLVASWDNQIYTVLSDANGDWMIKVKTPAAGGPYSISISDGKELVLKDILIGEVWICSGQSNMEMPLAGWGKILNYEKEIASADFPNIRLLHIKKTTSVKPEYNVETVSNGWQACSPAAISEFSSTAYFFGRELCTKLNVPVGLINTTWGGTVAEAWTSGESLEQMPDFRSAVQAIKEQASGEEKNPIGDRFAEWEKQTLAADNGMKNNVPVWAAENLNDEDWVTMKIPTLWEDAGLKDFDGIVWFRKTINIPAEWKGKDLLLNLDIIDDNDITYFNGTKVGNTENYATDRKYTVPGKSVKAGKAVITVRVTDNSGGGGIYGDASKIFVALKSDVSTRKIDLTGDWKYKPAVSFKGNLAVPQTPNNPNRTTVLYNAMIHPLIPLAFQGVIWYQGESNAGRAYQYRDLFPLMISDWRKKWNRDFPFYFVQLANYMKRNTEPQESQWAELREAQFRTLHLKNTGMAVIIDIGDAADIHPKNKQDVGKRLAYIAEANTYRLPVAFSGPLYENYIIEGNKIRIKFKYAENGLKTNDGKALTGFAIAGADHQFRWAAAVIEGNDVIVSSPDVEFPVAVRYGWADNPECNLYNAANLPASPFRTDDWRR